MKTKKTLCFALCIVVALCALHTTQTFAQNSASKQETVSNKSTVTLYVSFHCQACVNRLDKKLPYMKGIVDYVTKLSDKSVKITYKTDKTDLATIKKEIEKMDFIVADTYEELMKKMQ
ncbi:MAG: heavy-metal-associated domain-containing protein [Bacteroidales bacterium]|jgi:copper chaperone CopZ|nr:heavy-metal-associated domain-containing protein [Bacteroidales bacterium]